MEQIWQTLKETLNFSTKRMEREDLLQWGSWPNLQKTQEQDFEQELTVGRAMLLQQLAATNELLEIHLYPQIQIYPYQFKDSSK